MANKKNWIGILAMTLVFGLAVIGCDTGSGGGNGNGGERDSRFVLPAGYVWLEDFNPASPAPHQALVFYANGTVQVWQGGHGASPVWVTTPMSGTWSTSAENLNFTVDGETMQLPFTFVTETRFTMVFDAAHGTQTFNRTARTAIVPPLP